MSRNANICKDKYKYKYEQKQDVNVVIFSPLVPCPGSYLFWLESNHRGRARSKGQFLKAKLVL